MFAMWIIGWYALASVITLAAYWRDKRAARLARRRTRERTLHLLSAFGGWPGAIVAQRLLRHKNRRKRIALVTAVIALGHLTAWAIWWLRFS